MLAVLLCAASALYLLDPSSSGTARGLIAGIALALGLALFVVWVPARTRRRWLLILSILTALLAAVMTAVTVGLARSATSNVHEGLCEGFWAAALASVLWVVIKVAAFVELRMAGRPGEAQPRQWTLVAAVALPLAVVTAVTIVLVGPVPAWMLRFNSRVAEVTAAAPESPSSLTGSQRWSVALDGGPAALPTRGGLAVPVASGPTNSAGVVMIDPSTGTDRWRYELRGVDKPPEVQSTDDGRAIVVSFDESDLPDDAPARPFTLSADTGRLRAVWPGSGEVKSTDPPVLFDQVGQGTNAVLAISPAGETLWTYRPERCADPSDVTSTPTVMVVRAYTCDDPGRTLSCSAWTL